ncbi:MAG: VanZ family protein [Ignavibacteriales bacterium]|nr:VanZ family protein [Ignavibacteriales bacterium]MBK7378388.1 VanZ family protein [Ignavibacteriales bacterium]
MKLLTEKNSKSLVYISLIIYWIILISATSIPADSVPTTGVSDKIEHFLAYFILTILLASTLIMQNKFSNLKKHYLLSTLIIGIVYGAIDELHQLIVPGRSCELLDWLSDVGGVMLGIIFVKALLVKFLLIYSDSRNLS